MEARTNESDVEQDCGNCQLRLTNEFKLLEPTPYQGPIGWQSKGPGILSFEISRSAVPTDAKAQNISSQSISSRAKRLQCSADALPC